MSLTLYPPRKNPSTQWIGGWPGPTSGIDFLEKKTLGIVQCKVLVGWRKILETFGRDSNSVSQSTLIHVVKHFTCIREVAGFESRPEIQTADISCFAQFLHTNVWVSTLNQAKTVSFQFLLEVFMKYCNTYIRRQWSRLLLASLSKPQINARKTCRQPLHRNFMYLCAGNCRRSFMSKSDKVPNVTVWIAVGEWILTDFKTSSDSLPLLSPPN